MNVCLVILISLKIKTLSKFLCFLSKAAAAAFDLSTSIIKSSTSPCSRCLVFSSEEHLELMASTASSASCRRSASFFLRENRHRKISREYFCFELEWRSFLLCLLKLFSALDGVCLVFGSPLSHLAVGLGEAAVQLSFGLLFLLVLLS